MTPSLNKDYCVVLYCIISFVWDTNMAAISIVFCVSWDCVNTKNNAYGYFENVTKMLKNCSLKNSFFKPKLMQNM